MNIMCMIKINTASDGGNLFRIVEIVLYVLWNNMIIMLLAVAGIMTA